MIQQVMKSIDYSIFAEIALAIFVTIFVVISIKTLFSNPHLLREYARHAIDDHEDTNR